LPLRFAAKAGKMVRFRTSDGKTAGGFYVPPKRNGGPGIVMVHEWWGLNDYIRREAERLHDQLGYGVLAVDLYEGHVAKTPEEAGKLMQTVRTPRGTAIVGGAVKALAGGSLGVKSGRIGTIGWCFGGGWSHRAAIAGGPAVKACVMYYGMPDTDPASLERLKAPVLMVWATRDGWINQGVVDKFKSAMAAAKKPLTVLPFDADHGFANPSNPKFDRAAADKAWAATVSFYRKHLGS
jgi:carboxymethylenebutenolidase